MSRFLPFAAAFLIGVAIIAASGAHRAFDWPGWAQDHCADCQSSAQPRLASTGPRLSTGAIF